MLKQLSQPSFVNGFARSRGESVRPDLWDGLVCGCKIMCPSTISQYDFVQNSAVAFNWITTNYPVITSGYEGYEANCSINGNTQLRLGSLNITGPFTCLARINLQAETDENRGIFAYGDGTYLACNWILRRYTGGSGGYTSTIYTDGTAKTLNVSSYNVNKSGLVSFVLRYDGATLKIFAAGNQIGSTAVTGTVDNTDGYFLCVGSITHVQVGNISGIMVWNRALNDASILNLQNNPWDLLRRKKIWSMYVPSTGGVFKPYWCQTPTTIGAA